MIVNNLAVVCDDRKKQSYIYQKHSVTNSIVKSSRKSHFIELTVLNMIKQ